MDAQRIAVDAIVALTDCDREAATAFVRKCYLAGVRDPKRLTFKGLQALARNDVEVATQYTVVIPREGGGSSTPRLRFNHCCLWNTGSPAFAGDDNGICVFDLAT